MTSSLKLIAVIAICILLTGSADPSGELKPMPVSDLSGVPADVVFGRLYDNGLLPQDARMLIYAEGKPPAEAVNIIGALPEILKSNPPDFLIFSGTRDELNRVADTLEIARGEILLSPTLADLVNGKSTLRIPETRGDGASDGYPVLDTNTRGRMDLAEFRRMQSGRLSDVRISLDSAMGLNIYDCFSILSQVSGISIILDPYAFQEPVGGRRAPLQESPSPTPGRSAGGFRDASEFNTLPITSGGVPAFHGRFVDAPFDFVFETIVYSNNLDYIAITDPSRPYDKPILYVTSRERMEHELRLAGVSTIDVNQPHYADVDQITQILITMDILPSVDTGYYVYRGGFLGGQGGGGGFGGGGGGSGRGGQGGRGGAGGGGGLYGASIPLPTAKSGLIILRGTGGDQAAFYNRLIGRESKVRSGRKFFLRVALNPNALDDALSPENMTSFLLIL